MSPKQDEDQKDDRSANNPSFLGRIGAVIGMMKASAFVAANADEGRLATASRLGSASTFKSNVPESRQT